MEVDSTSIYDEKSEFLPDIENKKCSEIAFEQKVSRRNQSYIKSIDEIIDWHKSPCERRNYPSKWKNNKTSFN